jgi:hypothetical protein
MPGGRRPDESYLHGDQGLITAWPTKLAFAPKLANDLLDRLRNEDVRPSGETPLSGLDLPPPPLAQLPWEAAGWEDLDR